MTRAAAMARAKHFANLEGRAVFVWKSGGQWTLSDRPPYVPFLTVHGDAWIARQVAR